MSEEGSILVLSSSDLPKDVKVGDVPTMYYTKLLNPVPSPSGSPPVQLTPSQAATSVKDFFEVAGPPPTEMTVNVDTKFIDLSVRSFNNDLHVFLSKYILDCVWRDAEDPSDRLTASAGTSISRRVKVFLYAGNPSARESIRLLDRALYRDSSGQDPDFYVYRDQNFIYEKAHNPYHPNEDLSSDLYFENQYTQQSEAYLEPGLYIGKLHRQAISALESTRQITIRWESDRAPEHPSPFWHRKFLQGSSLWTGKTYEVHPPGNTYTEYFEKVTSVSLDTTLGGNVATTGGPYFPLTLYRLADPINQSVVPSNYNSNLANVADPLDGEVCPLNHLDATIRLGQIGVRNTTNLKDVNTVNMVKVAPSDETAFTVPVYDASAQNVAMLSVYDQSSVAFPPRYSVDGNCAIHFPNGAWRGNALSSMNTAASGWTSPFPWERSLTRDQMNILNEKQAYSADVMLQILDNRDYLFMDPGTSWNEHEGNVTVGERSLQFDFGANRRHFINKFQLIFPRSQEDHQPYRLEASMQREYKDSVDKVFQEGPETFWLGGLQYSPLSGSEANPDAYRYWNTHTQTEVGINGSYMKLWDVGARSGNSFVSPSSSSETAFITYASTQDSRGRANVVNEYLTHVQQWYTKKPNDVNPALDFQRQEFGPFTRGCTRAELKDTSLCKAWSPLGSSLAEAYPVRVNGTRFFFDLIDYMSSAAGSQAVGYCVYVRKNANESQASFSDIKDWKAVTSSRSGDHFAAVEAGNVYTYRDMTWTKSSVTTPLAYSSISSSGTGEDLMVSVDGGNIVLLSDYGNTSTQLINVQAWKDVVMSADGLTGLAVASNGHVHKYSAAGGMLAKIDVSSNIGTVSADWVDIAASQTGTTVAAITLTQVYVSVDSGATWTDATPSTSLSEVDTSNPWKSVTVSADGTRIVALPELGYVVQVIMAGGVFTPSSWTRLVFEPARARKTWQTITFAGGYKLIGIMASSRFHTYTPSGTSGSWTTTPTNPLTLDWDQVDIASSADGTKLIAGVYYGGVYLSNDGGSTWTRQTSPQFAEEEDYWIAVAYSADGSHAAAVVEDGYIYVYKAPPVPNPNPDPNNGWTRVESAGFRTWNAVSVSNTGTHIYAAVYGGYVYGSSDSGATWKRDVSPGTYQSWMGIVVTEAGGFQVYAIPETGYMYAKASTVSSQSLVSKTTSLGLLNWKSVDSSNDGEVAVAVVENGAIYTSKDSGETWVVDTSAGVHPWIAVTVSADGRQRVALASNGTVAVSFTTNRFYAYRGLDAWSVNMATPAPGHVWTSLDCSDDFTVLLATQRSTSPAPATGRVYASGWNEATNTLNAWTVDTRITQEARWNSLAMSRDGKRAIVGATLEKLWILDDGDIWYRLTKPSADLAEIRTLAGKTGLKARTKTATSLPPSIILDAEYRNAFKSYFRDEFDDPTYNEFQDSVYNYFFDRHKVYLVDCKREKLRYQQIQNDSNISFPPLGTPLPDEVADDMLLEMEDGQIKFETDYDPITGNVGVVQTYRAIGTFAPRKDYIVKESYYFAPQYDQYDTRGTEIIDNVSVFQPSQKGPQKMVNPSLAAGQYFGVAFGSFLYDKSNQNANEVYTRGKGNLMKLYSFRPLTQLYSFETTSGFIQDKTGTATTQATFKNTITKGMLGNVQLVNAGARYSGKESTAAFIHPTLDPTDQGLYYDASTGKFADTSMYLLEDAPAEIAQVASNGAFQVPRHAQVKYEMDKDLVSDARRTITASDKTELRRSAEFHLHIKPMRHTLDSNEMDNRNARPR